MHMMSSRRRQERLMIVAAAFGMVLATPLMGAHAQSPAIVDMRDCKPGMLLFPSDRSRIDPELLGAMASMTGSAARGPRPVSSGMEGRRQQFLDGFKEREAKAAAPPPGVSKTERFIPGPEGAPAIRVLVYSPDAVKGPRPAIVDIHGGSFVLGFPEMNEARNWVLSKDLGAVIVSVDYRLAPEHPFPAGVDDAYAVLEWVYRNAAELNIDPHRIVLSGDSAGGGIAASVALMARDRGKVPVKAQMLIYPSLDDRSYTAADPACAPGSAPPFNPAYALYLGAAVSNPDVSPYAFAARADSLAGLPSTFIAVGAVDGLADQSLTYARRLMWAGVATELHVYPGAFHGFDYATEARVTKEFHRDLENALRRAFE